MKKYDVWLRDDEVYKVGDHRDDWTFYSPAEVMNFIRGNDGCAVLDPHVVGKDVIELVAAAVFAGVTVLGEDGKPITGTPVPDAKVSYITRKELGAVLPEGWYIECQLNRYAACWGDAMTFPARSHLASAIADINVFLAMSIKQANDDLLASLQAQTDLAEMEQVPMWLSSDSA